MGRTDENKHGVIGPMNLQEGGLRGGKVIPTNGQTRRALSTINKNIIGAPVYPLAANKKPLTEKKLIFNKKTPPALVHRPVTRMFAAQLAENNNPQVQEEETKKPDLISNQALDRIIEDGEEGDFNEPMFVQHTEAMLEEIDRMEVIEIEDSDDIDDEEEETVMDIDSCDKNNPLALVEYVNGIYCFYKKNECRSCVPPNYMENQHDINERMRGILIDWLIEVHYKFELMAETLYLTINLFDRFLAVHHIARKRLQLVGVTAMLLACKYEEVSVPVVDDLIVISDKAYTRTEILDMEKLMANTLQFDFSLPTPYVFMRRFLKVAQSDKKLELLAFFIIELCLVEYEMLQYTPSHLAASAIYTAQSTIKGIEEWSKTSELHTGYTEEKLLECSRKMVAFHHKAGTGKLTSVHRKYSTSKFGYAAKTDPAWFLLV